MTTPDVPLCPSCGGIAWHIDADLTHRTIIAIHGGTSREVMLDRCDTLSTRLDSVATATCTNCAFLIEQEALEGNEAFMAIIRETIESPHYPWRAISDYREF